MSDWNYIIGEDNINQDFIIIDKGKNAPAILPEIDAADITIINTDLTPVVPAITNRVMNIISNDPLTLRYNIDVAANDVPQTPGLFLAIIRLQDTANQVIIKTFEIDLRVFIGKAIP